MKTQLQEPIEYILQTPEASISINGLLNKKIRLQWQGIISCRKCEKKTKKSFGEGFCYNCFISAPEASPCILKPELCEAHLGKGRDIEYEARKTSRPNLHHQTHETKPLP